MRSMFFIGIDPGTTGAVALLSPNGDVRFYDTPTTQVRVGKKNRAVYDVVAMRRILRDFELLDPTVTIEEVHAMPKNGGCGNFSSGYGFGLWVGLLTAFGYPFTTVQPLRWKKILGIKHAAGSSDADKKNSDRMLACRLFPKAADQMNLVKHHGRADALLIGEYGRRMSGYGINQAANDDAIFTTAIG
jgi:hypothetical protein